MLEQRKGKKTFFFSCFKLKRAVLGFSGLKRELPPWDRKKRLSFETAVLSCEGGGQFLFSARFEPRQTSLPFPTRKSPNQPTLFSSFSFSPWHSLLVCWCHFRSYVRDVLWGAERKKNVSYFFGGGFHLATKRKRRERKEIRFRSPKRSDIVQSDK